MKHTHLITTLFLLFFSVPVLGQQAKLEGHVYNDKEARVSDVRVIAPGGQAAVTDSQGHFTIAFPFSVQPGQATRIEVAKPGWVIYEPMLGNCVTQNSARNYEPLKVIIVVKGSPLALSPKRLGKVIAKWADERAKMRSQMAKLSTQLDEYAFLKDYSEKYGFTLDQFLSAAQQWAHVKDSDDKEEEALKEYFMKNYARAAQLAGESALMADEELERASQQRREASLKVIRRFKLEGNAFRQQSKFKETLAAYKEIDSRFAARSLSKEDLIGEWAEVKTLLGITKSELSTRVEGQEVWRFLREAVEELQQALTVFTREQMPEQWAVTQTLLGTALSAQGERMEGAVRVNCWSGRGVS